MHIINVRIHGSMTLKVSDILGERVIYFLLPSCLCTGCFLGHLWQPVYTLPDPSLAFNTQFR